MQLSGSWTDCLGVGSGRSGRRRRSRKDALGGLFLITPITVLLPTNSFVTHIQVKGLAHPYPSNPITYKKWLTNLLESHFFFHFVWYDIHRAGEREIIIIG